VLHSQVLLRRARRCFSPSYFLLKQFLGLIEDAARVVQVAARPKLLLYFSRAIQVLRDGYVACSLAAIVPRKNSKLPLFRPASV
jgi:hypothetical protein